MKTEFKSFEYESEVCAFIDKVGKGNIIAIVPDINNPEKPYVVFFQLD